MEETINNLCPACGSYKIQKIWPECRFNRKKGIRWCDRCGFGWQHPLPTPDEIKNYYNKFPTYNIHGENEKEKGFEKRIKQINKMMPQKGNLLDIGSGLGYFLKVALKNGWTITGIEPQASAAQYCRDNLGIAVYNDFINNIDIEPKSFDVITLWDVLEHVHAPLDFFVKCLELLSPNGLIVFAVPNASGWPARIFRGKWRYTMFTHLNYFTMSYIYKMVAMNKLEIEMTNHTMKIHSLLQGIASCSPFDINVEGIIRLGRKNSSEKNRPEQKSRSGNANLIIIKNILSGLRKIAHVLNLVYLPAPVGDLVDVYCRKKD